jgi:hypothetical protein
MVANGGKWWQIDPSLAKGSRGLQGHMPEWCSARRVQCPTCAVPDMYDARHVRCPTCTMPDLNDARDE